jgi:hypothetical protein
LKESLKTPMITICNGKYPRKSGLNYKSFPSPGAYAYARTKYLPLMNRNTFFSLSGIVEFKDI